MWHAPQVAYRDCRHCERYLYEEKGPRAGQVKQDRTGLPLARPKHIKPPCATCAKVPDSVRDEKPPEAISSADAISMSERSRAIYEHYLECKAVGEFPDDPLVRHHASLIRALEDSRERESMERIVSLIATTKRA